MNEDRRQEAAEWFAAQRRGAMTLEERERFDVWRSDRANQAMLDTMHQIWGESSALKTLSRPPQAVSRHRRLPALIAASAVIACVAAGAWAVRAYMLPHTTHTDIGEQRSILLADGSTISMNVVTRVDYRLHRDRRDIVLDDGEALFQVAPDVSRPFLVKAGDYEIRAVGTAFNVRRREGVIDVAVSEGVVSVRPLSGARKGQEISRLGPGRQLRLEGAPGYKTPDEAATLQVAGWRQRNVSYDDATVDEVVRDLNRFFPRPIKIEDRDLGRRRVTLSLQVADRRQTLDTLTALLSVKVRSGETSDTLVSD